MDGMDEVMLGVRGALDFGASCPRLGYHVTALVALGASTDSTTWSGYLAVLIKIPTYEETREARNEGHGKIRSGRANTVFDSVFLVRIGI